jgi:hypothetical protein
MNWRHSAASAAHSLATLLILAAIASPMVGCGGDGHNPDLHCHNETDPECGQIYHPEASPDKWVGLLCNDGIDNETVPDGVADENDPDCYAYFANAEMQGGDTCADGIDNDNNGATDCDDESCASTQYCQDQETGTSNNNDEDHHHHDHEHDGDGDGDIDIDLGDSDPPEEDDYEVGVLTFEFDDPDCGSQSISNSYIHVANGAGKYDGGSVNSCGGTATIWVDESDENLFVWIESRAVTASLEVTESNPDDLLYYWLEPEAVSYPNLPDEDEVHTRSAGSSVGTDYSYTADWNYYVQTE